MISSMTGFGRGEAEAEGRRARVELRSVNSRFGDIQVRCPNQLQEFESGLKEQIQGRIGRGKVSATVVWEDAPESSGLPRLDEAVARRYMEELQRLRELCRISGQVDLSLMGDLPGLFRTEAPTLDPEVVEQLLRQAVDQALEEFLQMRAREGRTLAEDLRARVILIEENLQRIAEVTADASERFRARLREKVEALLQPGEIDEDRLALEVVLLAERGDITEEIVRFHSHNAQFLAALDQGGEVGRRLNFLLQEMHREANTISSKAGDSQIVHLVVGIKEEVERLREQVQNIA